MTGSQPPGAPWRAALLAAVVIAAVAAPLAAAPAPAAAAGAQVSIADVTVSPTAPTPGELTRVETTIRNVGNRSQPIDVADVVVRERGSNAELARAEDLGTVTPGGQVRVPLTATFDDPGVHDLRVVVVAEDADGDDVHLEAPVTVVVNDGGPQLHVDVGDPSAGSEAPVVVNVTNGDRTAIRNLRLVVGGSNVRVDDRERIAAVLDGGAERAFTYTATFPDAGQSTVHATLRYTTTEGQTRTVEASKAVFPGATDPADRPQVEVAVADAVPGATRPVNVTVANGLDADVRQVRVRVASPSATFLADERVQGRLQAGKDVQFRFPARAAEAGAHRVNVTLAYTEGGLRHRVSRTIRANFGSPANPGEVALTDLQAVQRGGTLEVSATAGNVGSGAVEGVVVSVADAQHVAPADYFVGSIDGSDFSSFTLETRATGNVSSVPVEVQYVVGGVERTTTTEVPVERAAVEPRPPSGGGGLPVVPAAGVVVLLVALGLGYRRWG
ncbi:MAG: hypothetical protein ABEJ23_03350 [Haloarculaceae archaeon]